MTMLKKGFLSLAAIAVMTGFVGCGDDDIVTGGGTGTGGDTEKNYPDTIFALHAVDTATKWSKMTDALGSSVDLSGEKTDEAVTAGVVLTRVAKDGSDWPYADALAKMGGEDAADGSLAKLKKVIIGYTVNSFTNAEGKDDAGEVVGGGVSFAIADGYNTSTGNLAGWARYHAVLTKGLTDIGNTVYDTLSLKDFFLSYDSDAGDQPLDGTTLDSDAAQDYLAKCNNFTISMASEIWKSEQKLDITISEILLIGEDGLKKDMNID